MAERSEIESLVYLLEDPDEFVRRSVMDRLFALGEHSIPLLDELQVQSKDTEQKALLNNIIHQITYHSFEHEVINFIEGGIRTVEQLEEGLFLLCRFGFPTLHTAPYRKRLDEMAREIQSDIRYALSPADQMRILLHYVFYEQGFSGSQENYFSPEHSYLHKVIERKKGLPIALAQLVLLLAHRLGLPFYGVNMPMHFLLLFENDAERIYIDPFNKGNTLTLSQCKYFLQMNGIQPISAYFNKAAPFEIFLRSLRNLHVSYDREEDELRKRNIDRLLQLVEAIGGDGFSSEKDEPGSVI